MDLGGGTWSILRCPLMFFPPFPLQIIKKLIERKQAQIRKVYPGLTCFKEGVRQIPIESVPGIRESSGWRVLGGGGGRASS